jgi:hypothetical protein
MSCLGRLVSPDRESTVVPGQETRVVKESAILLDGDVEARKQHLKKHEVGVGEKEKRERPFQGVQHYLEQYSFNGG